MKTALLFVCASALAVTAQASTFCTFSPGTWCEQPVGPDAGQYISTAQYTLGTGPLNSIIGEINGTGGGDLFAIQISNTSSFAASYAPQAGTNPYSGATIKGDSQAFIYLFNASGQGIEAADDGTAIGGFNAAPGIYYVGITGDGNTPEYGAAGNRAAIFSPFVPGQISFPVSGAESLTDYSGDGCGSLCAGGYDISLTGAQYSSAPEPGSMALTGSVVGAFALLRRMRRKNC